MVRERRFRAIFKTLAEDRDNEYMMIDATIVRPTSIARGPEKKGGCQAIGRSRGGLTTKIHVIVDALGNPVACRSPRAGIRSRPGRAIAREVEPEALLADKAYDANALIDTLEERGITPVIPSKANRIVQRHRLRPLPRTKPRRALLRQTQGLPRYRNTLRQACQHFPGCNPAGLRHVLPQLKTRPKAFRQGSRPWCRTRAAIEDVSALSQGSLTLADVPPIS